MSSFKLWRDSHLRAPSNILKAAIAATLALTMMSGRAAERPLPATWWTLANSVNSDDLSLVKSLRALKWFDACAEWGAGVRSNVKSRKHLAMQLMLGSDGIINKVDLEHVPNKTVEIGMNSCGVIASFGRPDELNSTTTTNQTSAQMFYRSRKLYVYTNGKQNSGNGIVTAIQR